MKLRVLLIALFLLSLQTHSTSATPPKAGAICNKVGITKNYNGKKYTCVKSGKKLVWDKGVVVKVVTPTPTPTPTISASPTPTPTISASPTPTPTPTVNSLPKSWPLNQRASEDLIQIADASVRNYISDATRKPKINLLTGPNTDRTKAENYVKFLELSAIGWGKDWFPDEVNVALASVSDYSWIKEMWTTYGLIGGGFDSSKESWERFGNQCNQGSAIYATKPFFWGCLPSEAPEMIGLTKFSPHEYTHLVQYAIIYYQSGKKIWNLPFLFSEGSADFYGVTYASNNETLLKNWSLYWSQGYISTQARLALKSASVSEIELYLKDSMKEGKLASGHWYWTGAYATARLVAAKGHEGFVEYMRKAGSTGDVFQAFQDTYGISFDSFAELIAPEIKELTKKIRN